MTTPLTQKDSQQIAREAADQILSWQDAATNKGRAIAVILSVIERATADLAQELKLTTTQFATERCLDFDAEYEKGYTAGWEACDREEKLSRPIQCTHPPEDICSMCQPRGQQQEWTVEGKAIWNDCNPVGIATSSREAHQITNAHNAELAAARTEELAECRALTYDTICDLQDRLAARVRWRKVKEQ